MTTTIRLIVQPAPQIRTIVRSNASSAGGTGPAGPAGPTGPTGATGNGIASIIRTSGTGLAGTTDTYTITFTNATTTTYTVVNGANGATGVAGSTGATGATGNGIASIIRTSGTGLAGTTDTYTITFTDATTTTYTVVNGANGAAGAAGAPGQGVPVGGTTNQLLSKINATDYNTQWVSLSDLTASGQLNVRVGNVFLASIGTTSGGQINFRSSLAPNGSASNISINPGGEIGSEIYFENSAQRTIHSYTGGLWDIGSSTRPFKSLYLSNTLTVGTYTVGTLPSAPANPRARAFVADSNLAFNGTNLGATVTSGGSTLVPVFSNGTNWVIG